MTFVLVLVLLPLLAGFVFGGFGIGVPEFILLTATALAAAVLVNRELSGESAGEPRP